MEFRLAWVFCALATLQAVVAHTTHTAVETEMFSIPVSPNMFNWTYQEFDQQYRFHASLLGKPDLPQWLRYIYSGRHHSGFIFGTPPRGSKSPISLEVIGLNRQDFETRRLVLTLQVLPKQKMAKHEVELKIDNLNVEDLLDEHRMERLKDIFRTKLWTDSEDLYATFLSSAVERGARLPLRPNEGEGLVVRLGSWRAFSGELRRLREEVRPLSRLGSCPRDYKRTTVERLFRDAAFSLDWCSFQLYNTVYKERSMELVEYLSEASNPNTQGNLRNSKMGTKRQFLPESSPWSAPSINDLPTRSYVKEFTLAVVVPVLLMLVAMTALTAVLCFHYVGIEGEKSESFFENFFHICEDNKKRAHKSGKVELCRYGTGNTEQTQVPDNTSNCSLGPSPNNSLVRPYSPRSTTNLAGNYNRPQPPPYIGSNTNSLHHRKPSQNTEKTTPSTCSGHTPEHRGHLALEESLQLLNEANIASADYIDTMNVRNEHIIPIFKDPIIDVNDGAEDYVPIKPDSTGYVPMKPDSTGYVLIKPDLSGFGLNGTVGKSAGI